MIQRVGGAKLVAKMAALFNANAPARLHAIESALSEGNTALCMNAAHSLKSSAGQLGAVRLQDICESIETACNSENLSKARSLLPAVRQEVPDAVTWINGWQPPADES